MGDNFVQNQKKTGFYNQTKVPLVSIQPLRFELYKKELDFSCTHTRIILITMNHYILSSLDESQIHNVSPIVYGDPAFCGVRTTYDCVR